jgi:hypothetical protein
MNDEGLGSEGLVREIESSIALAGQGSSAGVQD